MNAEEKTAMNPISYRFRMLHRDQRGVYLLLGLVAILIIMLFSFLMMDTGSTAREKIKTQIAADSAAYSAASVRARSMNQVAFANIGKRTVVGITAGYAAVYNLFVLATLSSYFTCAFTGLLCDFAFKYTPLSILEGVSYFSFISNLTSSYKADIVAFDNVQQYFSSASSWWEWSEGVNRAISNGATMASTVPTPPYNKVGGTLKYVDIYRSILNTGYSIPILFNRNHDSTFDPKSLQNGGIPMRRVMLGMGDGMLRDEQGLRGKDYSGYKVPLVGCFLSDDFSSISGFVGGWKIINPGCLVLYYNIFQIDEDYAKPLGVASDPNFAVSQIPVIGKILKGVPFPDFTSGYKEVGLVFGNKMQPYIIYPIKGYDDWLLKSSIAVVAFKSLGGRNKEGKENSKLLLKDRNSFMKTLKEMVINKNKVGGIWAVSKSEVFFKDKSDSTPDLWHTNWSARMRPLNLDGEWKNIHASLGDFAYEAYPFMIQGLVYSGAFEGVINDPLVLSPLNLVSFLKYADVIRGTDAVAIGK